MADGAETIVVSGDLDYIDFAEGWDQLITNTLGASYPMLVTAGNHDEAIWPEYQAKIVKRWQMAGLTNCEGVVGVAHVCTWEGGDHRAGHARRVQRQPVALEEDLRAG